MLEQSSTKFAAFSYMEEDRPWSPIRTCSSVSSLSGLTSISTSGFSENELSKRLEEEETCSLFSALSSVSKLEYPWSSQLRSAIETHFPQKPDNEAMKHTEKLQELSGTSKLRNLSKTSVRGSTKSVRNSVFPSNSSQKLSKMCEKAPVTFDWGAFWETRQKCLNWLQKYCITSTSPPKNKKRR